MTSDKHRKLAEVAEALNAAHPAACSLPPLFFLTDEGRAPDPLAALTGLPDRCGVVFRHYGAKDRMDLARKVGAACRAQERLLLIADEVAIPEEVDAGGLHLPSHMLRTLTERPAAPLVTAAAHNDDELRRAEAMGVDAVFLSPVFGTESHPNAPHLGVEHFTKLAASTHLPVYALGGITGENAPALLRSGAYGIAAIGALL